MSNTVGSSVAQEDREILSCNSIVPLGGPSSVCVCVCMCVRMCAT